MATSARSAREGGRSLGRRGGSVAAGSSSLWWSRSEVGVSETPLSRRPARLGRRTTSLPGRSTEGELREKGRSSRRVARGRAWE
eukprot:15446230-Alexandrium_andersonii.AAC.1